jgi:hypothetical protein
LEFAVITDWNIAELEIGICYIRHVCGDPPQGFELEVLWREHELGGYPMIGLSWNGPSDAPEEYISRAERALNRFNEAVEWSAIEPEEDVADQDGAEQDETDEVDGEFNQSGRIDLPSSKSSDFVPPDQLPFDLSRVIKQAIVDWETIQPLGFTRPTNESSGGYIVTEMESMGLRRLNGETAWFKANATAETLRACVFAALDHWLIAAEISTKKTPEEMDEYQRPLGE